MHRSPLWIIASRYHQCACAYLTTLPDKRQLVRVPEQRLCHRWQSWDGFYVRQRWANCPTYRGGRPSLRTRCRSWLSTSWGLTMSLYIFFKSSPPGIPVVVVLRVPSLGQEKHWVAVLLAGQPALTNIYNNYRVIIHLPLAHFPPTFLTHLPPVNEPFTPYVWHFYPLRFDTLPPFFRFFQGSYFVSLSWAVAE